MNLEKTNRTNYNSLKFHCLNKNQILEWLFPWLWSGTRRLSIFSFISRSTEAVFYRRWLFLEFAIASLLVDGLVSVHHLHHVLAGSNSVSELKTHFEMNSFVIVLVVTTFNCKISFTRDRLNSFSSRCSIINTDVCHDFVTTDDDIHEDLPTPIDDHSIPIVHLDTNIAVTDSLSLLTECTYVDTVLTALPVCSSPFWSRTKSFYNVCLS